MRSEELKVCQLQDTMMRQNRHTSSILTEGVNMSDKVKLPEVIVFAGPNGSGKSTITRMARTVGEYINTDDIKKSTLCSDLETALKA
jgi:Fe-S cluster assembly ATPase SufC